MFTRARATMSAATIAWAMFLIEGLAKVPAGNQIVVQLDLNLNGVLKVTAREKATGLHKHITIDNALERFGREEREAASARLEVLWQQSIDENANPEEEPGGFMDDEDDEAVEDFAMHSEGQGPESAMPLLDAAPARGITRSCAGASPPGKSGEASSFDLPGGSART